MNQEKTENIEGLDQIETAGWGEDYPLDSVFVRKEVRTAKEVVERIRKGRFELHPDFQRDFIWSSEKQSRLIESCLMRLPLPVFYLAEAKDGKIIVVDGLQRLTTFKRFMNNEFVLFFGKDSQHKLAGQGFEHLEIRLQERIEDTQLTLYILEAGAPERAKLDIFERVNSGVPLSRQQMRNCLYNGEATQWLKKAAESPAFVETTGESLDAKSMRDREAINRFCAFHLRGEQKYKGDMDVFLAKTLEQMNEMPTSELDNLQEIFERSMRANQLLFGEHAFRKSLASPIGRNRAPINIALFDVCSVLLASLEDTYMQPRAGKLRETMIKLLQHEEFNQAISISTGNTKQVHTRFRLARAAIEEVIHAD
jgi:hypothetical protein